MNNLLDRLDAKKPKPENKEQPAGESCQMEQGEEEEKKEEPKDT